MRENKISLRVIDPWQADSRGPSRLMDNLDRSSPKTHQAGKVMSWRRRLAPPDTSEARPQRLLRRVTSNLILYGRPEWTRTIDLFRVKELLTRIFNNFESTDGKISSF